MIERPYWNEVYAIVGAAMEVHTGLGTGFLEAVYQEATEIEMTERRVPFVSQKVLPIYYKGRKLKKEYIADFICYGAIIVEIKAVTGLTSKEEAQVLNYLTATKYRVGLLINFGSVGQLEWKRLVK